MNNSVAPAHYSRWSGNVSRAYWLPSRGFSNGLDADAWAPIADVDESEVGLFLQSLRDAGIPGYAARRGGHGLDGPYGIWVGTWYYSRAEDVLARMLQRMQRDGQGRTSP